MKPGDVVREARNKAGLTLDEVSTAIGESRVWLHRRETGATRMKVSDLKRLVAATDEAGEQLLPLQPDVVFSLVWK